MSLLLLRSVFTELYCWQYETQSALLADAGTSRLRRTGAMRTRRTRRKWSARPLCRSRCRNPGLYFNSCTKQGLSGPQSHVCLHNAPAVYENTSRFPGRRMTTYQSHVEVDRPVAGTRAQDAGGRRADRAPPAAALHPQLPPGDLCLIPTLAGTGQVPAALQLLRCCLILVACLDAQLRVIPLFHVVTTVQQQQLVCMLAYAT